MQKIRWNTGWKFWKEKDAFALVWNVPEDARDVTLPHDAMIEEKADPESLNGGNTGFRNGGTYIYVKRFQAPAEWAKEKTEVFFEGIYMNAMVYLNGQMVAHHPYGYTGFTADLSDYLKYGRENELRVVVRTGAMPNSRWYTGSGIYRDVWLLRSPKNFLPYGGLQVKKEDADEELAILSVRTEIFNESDYPAELRAETEIVDPNGDVKGKDAVSLFLKAGEKRTIRQRMTVERPLMWSAERPNLYEARTKLIFGENVLDREETTFGIRTMTLDAKRGFRVNKKAVLLRGACIHHNFGILGAVQYYDAACREVTKLKEAGFNAIRMAHHPMSDVMLRACDELGMYVMDELTDVWTRYKSDYDYSHFFDDWWQKDVKAMVQKDINHPSVILYSIGNEIPEIGTNEGSKTAHDIAAYFHFLDDSRYTTAGINGVFAAGDCIPEIMADLAKETPGENKASGESGGNVNDFMTLMNTRMDDIVVQPCISERLDKACEALDVAGYNYMTARYEKDLTERPNRIIVGTETYPPAIARNWAEVQKCSNVIGDFTWTGWDYIGEAGTGIPAYHMGEGGFSATFPAQLSYVGDIDITGFRRPASYYREIAFGLRKKPYLAVQDPAHYKEKLMRTPWVISDASHSWSFPDFEGKPIVAEVYGDGEAAELILNGRSLGRKKMTVPGRGVIGNRALFEMTYEPGVLTAILYDRSGQELGRDTLISTGGVTAIKAEIEPSYSLKRLKGERKLTFITLNLTDADGRATDSRSYDMKLHIVSSENADILGFGSGDPKPLYNYNESVTNTWYGRAQLILEKEEPSRRAQVVIRSENGLQTEIEV